MNSLRAERIIASLLLFVVAKLLGLKTRMKDRYAKFRIQKAFGDGDTGWMCGHLINILIYSHVLRFYFSEP